MSAGGAGEERREGEGGSSGEESGNGSGYVLCHYKVHALSSSCGISDNMYTTERRRMSLRELKRKDPVWVSAGSLWQDSLAIELTASGSVRPIVSPRSRTRAVSVAYILNEDASVPQTEENLSLKCLKEACADAQAVFKTIPFERISLGTTDILDSFYNAGKCRHADCGVI
ncbi:hypothetical protein F7725_018106 [Dissostichus mawsoni]|uniref:MAP3K deoxyribohydrolase domain-containing protein n=1 Tax=Dissostichus mawsoni TaxID=36200 RepID=A0A7J5XS75_DISMA|nr:hypothetical protein F7725_018106 [Dissostichus mawsoni]